MEIPIDCRRPPGELKKKGRIFARWFVFGESPETVDLADGEEDVIQHLPREKVATVLALRDEFLDRLEALLCDPS
jgi:hypothetical protein